MTFYFDKQLELIKIGHLIKTERVRRGINLEKMAHDLELNPIFVDLIENGQVKQYLNQIYSFGYIYNLLNYLSLDKDEILKDINFSDEYFFSPKNNKNKFPFLNYKNLLENNSEENNQIEIIHKKNITLIFAIILFLVIILVLYFLYK